MCDQTQNFSLSIKLIYKNHIIYNKEATNTQNLFNLMKEKKIIVGILGCEEDDMNKKSSLGETQILFFFFFNFIIRKKMT